MMGGPNMDRLTEAVKKLDLTAEQTEKFEALEKGYVPVHRHPREDGQDPHRRAEDGTG